MEKTEAHKQVLNALRDLQVGKGGDKQYVPDLKNKKREKVTCTKHGETSKVEFRIKTFDQGFITIGPYCLICFAEIVDGLMESAKDIMIETVE